MIMVVYQFDIVTTYLSMFCSVKLTLYSFLCLFKAITMFMIYLLYIPFVACLQSKKNIYINWFLEL